jgi:alpha-acetolactate decarboxylase
MLNVNEAREIALQHHERNEELRAVLASIAPAARAGHFSDTIIGPLTEATIDALQALGYDVTITEKGITVTWI